MSKKTEQQEIKLEIQIDEDVAQGVYSNLVVMNHSDAEFVLDFIFMQPQAPRAKVRSRVITSPRHLKKFLAAMDANLKEYEKRFGPIDVEPGDVIEPTGNYH